ncbi:hypothetical protein FisN_40Lh014 [Fistulifera solaris]|uniref:HSF-type DNA-binding domain-containing protein n=1 Tax=Fistulifera solaris TaxID=1519565 RepID=A0A1Z5J984_FISSO|nr:hypothetical protein FisN_40Lh014 [Fistulifera solaris]|eukprot:GAX10545.1 hypothetical protein FisN_40Lh014 [Fistulifera solaris]
MEKIQGTGTPKKRPGRKPAAPEPFYPVKPVVIQRINKPRTFVNHSYRDFSQVPPEDTDKSPTDLESMTFSQKLFTLLNEPDAPRYIAWSPHGRSFRVIVPKLLEQSMLLQKYFGHNRYSSFLRQLTNYGFKHITKGIDRNSYYHETFLQGGFHLLKYMPEIKDIRRQIADPDNEPDFYEISQRFPVSLPSETSNEVAAAAASANVLPVATFLPVKTEVTEEPPLKRPRLLRNNPTVSASLTMPHRPLAVSLALTMSRPRPQMLPHEARLQMLQLLHQQEKRRELILTSMLLRRHHHHHQSEMR